MGGLAHHTESSSPGAEIWAASRAPRTTPPTRKGGAWTGGLGTGGAPQWRCPRRNPSAPSKRVQSQPGQDAGEGW